MNNKVELLSPARNCETGIEAIRHGADAVYIGAERFGARAAAGNSVQDIERLAEFAHRYRARVFVTINTLMTEKEMEEARALSWQLYEAGADAFIVQDTRFALMDLPPVELHASTQCDIRTKERVAELRRLGFTQMVLARELSIPEIKAIADSTDAVIETFCHGALCVCYSGRCFMSEAVTGRSANRGECAQMCRLPYDLINGEGETMMRGKHLLSLKDFDATLRLGELLDAGVRCLKIEGRLKDVNYVKNITAWYRQRLDEILRGDDACVVSTGLRHRSLGDVRFEFEPDVRRTFYRGGTEYFLSGSRPKDMCTMVTGKAMGEPISASTILHNGDGVCWVRNGGETTHASSLQRDGGETRQASSLQRDGVLEGCMIDGKQRLPKGVQLYRNNDIEFERILNGNTADRKIPISIEVNETPEGFACQSQLTPPIHIDCDKQPANDPEKIMETWRRTLSKTGDTEFRVDEVRLNFTQPWFVPVSKIAELRRSLITSIRTAIAPRKDDACVVSTKGWWGDDACVVSTQQPCNVAEYGVIPEELMRCRYCIRYEIGQCLKNKGAYRGDLLLRNSAGRMFRLEFDCKHCEMVVKIVEKL